MATGSGGVCGQDAGFAGWCNIYLTAPENMRWIGVGPASHHADPEPYTYIYIYYTSLLARSAFVLSPLGTIEFL